MHAHTFTHKHIHTHTHTHTHTTENPSPMADRTLKLVTKGVQNLANLVEFKKKEDFTVALNPFIKRNQSKMRKFVDDVAVRCCSVEIMESLLLNVH